MTVRVLYAISSLHRGGAERQLVELIRGLDRSRYKPHLALCDTTNEFPDPLDVGTVIDLQSAGGSTVLTLARLVRALRAVQPDILHTFGGLLNIYGRLAVRLAGHGVAISAVRNGRPPRRDLVHEALAWPLADAIVANSVGIRDTLVRRSGIPAHAIDVVENGVDTARFHPLDDSLRNAARHAWGFTGRVIVLPARRSAEKNHLGVIRALGTLRRRAALPRDVHVVFVGRPHAPTHEAVLRAAVQSQGVGGIVRFHDAVHAMPSLLAAADVVVLPSEFEGMPNVVLEAMACGTPTLVSPPANLDGLVRDGLEGTVAHGTSAGALAEALSRWLALSPAARAAMGHRARTRAMAYSLEAMVARTCDVYSRTLSARGRPT